MRTTLEIDPKLLRDAMRASGAPSKTAAVRLGLEALVEVLELVTSRRLAGRRVGWVDAQLLASPELEQPLGESF